MADAPPKKPAVSARLFLQRALLACVLPVLLALGLGQIGFLKQLELQTLDKRFKWRSVGATHPGLLVIAIDDGDMQQFGKWPWPRDLHARMLGAFTNAAPQPAVIAYNIIFSAAKEDAASQQANGQFAAVIQGMGNICLAGQVMLRQPADGQTDYSMFQQRAIPLGDKAEGAPFQAEHKILVPDARLQEGAHLGLLNVKQDEDGVIRNIPLLVREGQHWIPALALRAVMLFHGADADQLEIDPGRELRLRKPEGGWLLRVSLDQDQQMRINYRGNLTDFALIPFRAVTDWLDKKPEAAGVGQMLAATDKGVVVVGTAATGDSANMGVLPIRENSPLIAVHVNAINSLLNGDFLKTTPWWTVAVLTLGLAALSAWLSRRFSAVKGVSCIVGALALYYGITWGMFAMGSFWIPWVVPPLGLILAWSAGTILQFTGVEKRSKKVADAFQSYVSADLVKKRLRGATGGQPMDTEKTMVLNELLPELAVDNDGSSIIGLGGYNLLCKLGQGGMGAVFLGREKAKKRYCAVKVLNPQFSEDRDATERFLREARTMSGLVHPNLVALYQCDQVEGQYFIAMEYIEGMSVGDILKDKGAIPLPLAFHWLKQAAAGLEYIHGRTMIHRDIKPDNLMVNSAVDLKITDLGLAKDRSQTDQAMTVTGTVMGSPHYMSPEQVQESKNVDHRADLYSLGVSFYQMVAGHVPFDNKDSAAAVCMAHLNEPIPSVALPSPELTAALDELILKMTAKDKEQRFQSATEILQAIQPWLEYCPMDEAAREFFTKLGFENRMAGFVLKKNGINPATIDADVGSSIAATDDLSTETRTASDTSATLPPRKRFPAVYWMVAGAVLLILIGGVVYWFFLRTSPEETEALPASPEAVTLQAPQPAQPSPAAPTPQPASAVSEPTGKTAPPGEAAPSVPPPSAVTPTPTPPPSAASQAPVIEKPPLIPETPAPAGGKPAETKPAPAPAPEPAPPPAAATVETNRAPAAAAAVVAAPKMGRLTVITSPVGATVLFRDISKPGPAQFDAAPIGKYPVKIHLEGYQDIQAEVEVTEGEMKPIEFSLKKSEPVAPGAAPAP